MLKAFLWSLLLLAGTASAIGNDELLDVHEAFPAAVQSVGRDAIRLRFQVAKGYYLYRDKLRFKIVSDAIRLGDPVLPKGKIKDDEFLGKKEIYRGTIKVTLPLAAASAGSKFVLKIEAQGCADIGVCYPVFEQSFPIELPAA